jgi:hypothetical protein
MSKKPIYKDAFNLLCGDKLGEGSFRTVYECRLRPDLVVKVSNPSAWRDPHNTLEAQFWADYKYHKVIGKWLAPIHFVSPDTRIILMERAMSFFDTELPVKVPACFQDVKPSNFGRLSDGRIVCVDYALTRGSAPANLVAHGWTSDT